MLKTYKLLIFFFFAVLFLGFLNHCLAFTAAIEVPYPVLPGGSSLNENPTIPQYLKYVFDFAMFAGFIAVIFSLAIAGVQYFLSPAIPSLLAKAKDRIFGAFSGLLLLLLVYLIIVTINPGLNIFKITELIKTPDFPPPPPLPGVYLYKSNDCSPPEPGIHNGDIPNIPTDAKPINSVKIVQDYENEIFYISILYESPNLRGKCLVVNPNTGCHGNIEPFASSASISRDSKKASGDIIFYRNSFFEKTGGYFILKSSDIQSYAQKNEYLIGHLEELRFIDPSARSQDSPDGCTVPKNEQDCIKWDNNDVCQQRQCPNLVGKNIGSVEIKGDYIVLFVYKSPTDAHPGPWTFCQAFPSPDDASKNGPTHLVWQDIQNNRLGKTPNYFIIIPIKPD